MTEVWGLCDSRNSVATIYVMISNFCFLKLPRSAYFFKKINECHCSGFGEKEKWKAHKRFPQKWNHCRDKSLRVCDLTCMLQKTWALLRAVSAKGSAILGGFERRGRGWPQGFRRWLITLLWKDQRMNDWRHSTIVGGRKVFQVFCGCCCFLRQSLMKHGPVSNSVLSRMTSNHWSSCLHFPCAEISGLCH